MPTIPLAVKVLVIDGAGSDWIYPVSAKPFVPDVGDENPQPPVPVWPLA